MPTTDQRETLTLDLSRAEQWVVHHVVMTALHLINQDPPDTADEDVTPIGRAVLEKIETGNDEFTPRELALVHRTCTNHARLTEELSDENLASAVTNRIETVLGESFDPSDEGCL